MNAPSGQKSPFTPYEKLVIALLAFLQFTIILDFMILSPLGAMLMPALQITPGQFGLVVSAYAFSAGTAGFLAAGFADRYDRKKLLIVFYLGFVLGTFLCGIAPTYHTLLAARIVTGLFGGVIGSTVFAITTDLFPFQKRGRVMGMIQTAFAASQVLGLPFGLFLANHLGWHAPFLMIVGVSLAAGVVITFKLQPITEHLKLRTDKNPLTHLVHTVSKPRYLQGFATTALLSTGGFMLMPFSSAFNVHNLGIPLESLPILFAITGFFSIFIGPFAGRMSDKLGKFPMFCFGSALTVGTVLVYTRLGITPMATVAAISVLMWMGISSRMISASALMSALPEAADRGAYMAVSSSIQQVSGGVAAALAGMIVSEGVGGSIEHFDRVGYVFVFATAVTLVMMFYIDRYLHRRGPLPQA